MALQEPIKNEKVSSELTLTSSSLQFLLCACSLVLTIIALAGVYPVTLLAIATILIGLWLIVEGGALSRRLVAFARETPYTPQVGQVGVGLTAEFFGGIAGIILGIIGLAGGYPWTVLPVAAMAMGASLIFGSGIILRLNELFYQRPAPEEPAERKVADQAVILGADFQAVMGLGALALGIIAIRGPDAILLTLVAVLALGAGGLLISLALSGRMASMLRHNRYFHRLAV